MEPGDVISLPALLRDAWGRSRLNDRPQSASPLAPSCLGWCAYPGSHRDGGNRKTRGEALVGGRVGGGPSCPFPPVPSVLWFLKTVLHFSGKQVLGLVGCWLELEFQCLSSGRLSLRGHVGQIPWGCILMQRLQKALVKAAVGDLRVRSTWK